MNRNLHRLVYYSRNKIANSPERMAATIEEILSTSRRNNPRSGLSGALMFNKGCFAQVLEGSQAAIESIFERIQLDERHSDVAVLSFGRVEARSFVQWSMAFVGESKQYAAQYGNVASQSGYDPSSMTGDAIFEALHLLLLQKETSASTQAF